MNYQITFENGQQKGCLLLAQWDRDAQLTITGLPQTFTDIEIHWGNRLMEEFYVVEPTIRDDSVIVLIPNILLQAPENIIGYIYLDSTATCYRIDIEIQARQKPQGVPTDPTVPFYPLGTGIFDTDSEKAINAKAVLSILKGGDTGQSLKKKSDEDLDFEWSSDGTVDQHYDPESENAQSGKAVAEAVANFITNTVDNLTNYYLKSETYNRTEVNNLIGAIQTAHFEIVSVLPPIGESNVIYLILRSEPETSNIYDEYIYINNAYEKIGSTDIDLTGYATEDWVNQQIANFLTQTQIQSLINTALTNYYTKTEADALLDNKADVNGIYDEMIVGNARNLVSTKKINDNTPYNFRTSGGSLDIKSGVGNLEEDSLVGGTVAWNQLADNVGTTENNGIRYTNNRDGSWTINGTASADSYCQLARLVALQNHVVLLSIGVNNPFEIDKVLLGDFNQGNILISENQRDKLYIETSSSIAFGIQVYQGQTVDNFKIYPQIFDLTQMFGSTVADYIYSLEQTTTGAGATYFRALFPKDYYEYNAGTFISVKASAHKMVGFNAYNPATGTAKLVGNRKYQITGTYTSLSFEGQEITLDSNNYYTPSTTGTLIITGGNNTDTCVHLVWDGERDGDYEPYYEVSYPLSDVELSGIPLIDSNSNLYYDGDVYSSEGKITRNYAKTVLKDIPNKGPYGNTGHMFRFTFIDGATSNLKVLINGYTQTSGAEYSYNAPNDKTFYALGNSIYLRDDSIQTYVDLSSYGSAPTFSYSSGSNTNFYKKLSVDTYADIATLKTMIGTQLLSTAGYYIIEVLSDEEQSNRKTYYAYNPNYNTLTLETSVMTPSYADLLVEPSDWATNWSDYYQRNQSFDWTQFNSDLIYSLQTPTIETTDTYTNPQYVNDWGTEEYVDDRAVAIPVGHNTKYTVNLKSKLEMAPDSPNQGDGDYLVRQTDGVNEYVKYIAPVVDQTYDPTSTNAQSGTAVAEAVENKLTEPSSGLAVGKYFHVASIDDYGHAVLECVDLPEQIFVATYGVTTYSEISEAIKADKEIICWYDFRLYRCMEDVASAVYRFTCADNDIIYQISVFEYSNKWHNSETQLVKEKNLNQSITTLMTTEPSGTIWSDAQKNGCYNRIVIRKTTLDSVLVPNANYDLYHLDNNNRVVHFPAGYNNYHVIVYKGSTIPAGTYRLTMDEYAFGGITSYANLFVNDTYQTAVEKRSDTLTDNTRIVEFTLYNAKDSFLLMIGNYGKGTSMDTYYQNPSMYKIVNGEPTGDDLIQKFTTDNVVFTTSANRVTAQTGKWTTLNWASGYIMFDIIPQTFTFSLPEPSNNDNYSNNKIYVAFRNGSTPSTLSISGTYTGDTGYTPIANSISELKFRYVCGTWVLVAKDTTLTSA